MTIPGEHRNGTKPLRVATYNIHKCRGMDGRVRIDRIATVLNEIGADIVALQEVVCVEGDSRREQQARYLAEELGYRVVMGENRRHNGGAYGNALLSRLPIHTSQNYDLSVNGRERRGCLRADLELRSGALLHVFNLHLGTSYLERRKQARQLFEEEILDNCKLSRSTIVLGDFNEWTKGLASRLLRSRFSSAASPESLGRSRTYPGVLPFLRLDQIYFDDGLQLAGATLHRSRNAIMASDHLPLVAQFQLPSVPRTFDPIGPDRAASKNLQLENTAAA